MEKGCVTDLQNNLFSFLTLPVSRSESLSQRLVIVSWTLTPAWSMEGASPSMETILRSGRRFLSTVFRFAASHTRLMHSLKTKKNVPSNRETGRGTRIRNPTHLAIAERVSKSKTFIDVLTSKHPIYCEENVAS